MLWIAKLALMALMATSQGTVSTTPANRLNEDWWRDRHQAKLKEVAKGGYDLVFVGDSITHGWEGGEALNLWSAYYAPRKALDLGYSGDRTEHVLWRLDNGEFEGLKPKTIVLMIGTNNLGHRPSQTPEDTALGVKTICERFKAKAPSAKILLLSVFPRTDQGAETAKNVEKLNRLIEPLGKERNITFLDMTKTFLEPDGSLSRDIMPDLLHPGATGYWKWAEGMEPTLRKLMGRPQNSALEPAPKIEEDGYDWQRRHNDIVEAGKTRPVDVVFIGDSITHNFGGESTGRKIFGTAVWDRYYGKRNALNLGFGWDRIQQVLWRIDNGELDHAKPKVATVLIGTNNLAPGQARVNTDTEVFEGVRAVCERIRKKSPATKILLLGLLPRGVKASEMYRQRIAHINTLLATLNGKRGVTFLDISSALLDTNGALLPNVTYDSLHPSEAGYRAIAAAIEPTLSKLLGDKPLAKE